MGSNELQSLEPARWASESPMSRPRCALFALALADQRTYADLDAAWQDAKVDVVLLDASEAALKKGLAFMGAYLRLNSRSSCEADALRW